MDSRRGAPPPWSSGPPMPSNQPLPPMAPVSPANGSMRSPPPMGPPTPSGSGNPAVDAGRLTGMPEAKEESQWEEYTDQNGKKYWHNKITKRAQWEKPDELKTQAEREADSCPWKEFIDGGKKYFYNEKTRHSQWEMPEEYRLYLDRVNAAKDPKDVFKQLLLDRGMTTTWSWEQVISETKDDERSKLMKISDRKQIFQDLQAELRRREVEEKRRKQEQLFKDFYELLETTPGLDEFSSFREATELAARDQRWINVPERDRKAMWDDCLVERARRKKEAEKQIRKQHMDALMKELESDPRLDVNYTWHSFVRDYADSPNFRAIAPIDRLQVFQDFIGPLEDAVEKKYKEKKDVVAHRSRKARDAFRNLLKDRWVKGEIKLETKWRDFVNRIRTENALTLMVDAVGSTPAELFYDFIDDLEKKFREDKRRVRGMMKSFNLEMSSGLTYDVWLNILKQHDDFVILDQSNLQTMFNELQSRAKQSEERRRRHAAPSFFDVLRKVGTSKETSWESIRVSVLESLKALADEASQLTESDMRLLFTDYQANIDSDEEEGALKEDELPRHNSRSHRGRSRSSSRSGSASPSRSRSRSHSRSRSPARHGNRHSSSGRTKRRREDAPRADHDASVVAAPTKPDEAPSPKRPKLADPKDVEEGELLD